MIQNAIMELYFGLLNRKYKLFACLLIICICLNLVESHAYNKKVLHPNKARDVPDGFVEVGVHNIQLYLYEIMSCYADKGYPCRTNPAFIGHHVKCLSKDKVCDGIKQCPFGDDENGRCGDRLHFCKSNQVRCVEDGRCATTCDGLPECKYAADEKQCDKFPCSEHQVLCSDGKCANLCDGVKECKHGKDEKDCLPKCDTGETTCPQGGKCAKFCDGKPECDQAEDERFCPECPEQQDIPCDVVRLSECFYNGFCRVLPTSCNTSPLSGVLEAGALLPCVKDGFLTETLRVPKNLPGCKSRRQLTDCICNIRERLYGPTFEVCVSVVFDLLGDCDFLE